MKKLLFSLCFLLAFSSNAWSKQRSLDEMKAAAGKVITNKGGARSVAAMKVINQNAQLTVLGYAGGGYAVIANDDRFPAVFGYSDATQTDEIPTNVQWWMNAVTEALETATANGQSVERSAVPASYKSAVPQMLTCTWGQEAPFNRLCPTYTTAGGEMNYITGCVATAMSQIMYYYKWPVTGFGSKRYYFTPEGGGNRLNLNANFGETTYDWNSMLNSYDNGYNDTQAEAVATLMYHCGVAVEMQYNQSGSGARPDMACKALREYFRYNDNIKMYTRDYFPQEEWMNIVYRELNDNCPLLYGGSTLAGEGRDGAGHSFVIDGYNEDGLVHVNWGWDGAYDGYYDISMLNPQNYPTGFVAGQSMIIVRTENDNRFTEPYKSMLCLIDNLKITNNGTSLTCDQNTMIANVDIDIFEGNVMLVATNMDTNVTTELGNVANSVIIEYGNGASVMPLPISVASLPDGKYRVYLASKSFYENEAQPVRSNEKVNNSYIMTKNGTSITLTAENNSNWTSGITNVETASEDDGIVRVYNISGVMVYSAPANAFNVNDIPATGVLIIKNGDNITKVKK